MFVLICPIFAFAKEDSLIKRQIQLEGGLFYLIYKGQKTVTYNPIGPTPNSTQKAQKYSVTNTIGQSESFVVSIFSKGNLSFKTGIKVSRFVNLRNYIEAPIDNQNLSSYKNVFLSFQVPIKVNYSLFKSRFFIESCINVPVGTYRNEIYLFEDQT